MLTATYERAQQIARLSVLLAVWVGAAATQGCYQPPPPLAPSDLSSSPAAAQSSTGQTPATGISGSTVGNSNDSNTVVPAVNVGTMTLTPASNPFICLGADTVVAGAKVSLTTCNGASTQKWLLRNLRLQLGNNLCISFAASGTAALKSTPVLATCDTSNTLQQVLRGSGGNFAMTSEGSNYAISAQIPTATNSNVTFENNDTNQLGQNWVMGSDNAASGKLQIGGMRIAASANNSNCLTVTGASLGVAPCSQAASAQQEFRWNESAQIVFNGNCLTALAQGPCKFTACNPQDGNQRWVDISGNLQPTSGLGCLSSQDGTLAACPTDASYQFELGTPLPK